VHHGTKPRASLRRWGDARADDRKVRTPRAKGTRERETARAFRLDEEEIGLVPMLRYGNLQPEPRRHAREQRSDIGLRFQDQDARHGLTMVGARVIGRWIQYESGMDNALVLIVDDDEDIRSLVRELAARAGYRTADAADGAAALRLLYDARPDLVVLDVQMPGMDGWQTLARIREVSDVPVLMLTARGAELERVRGLQQGADDYVVKPFGRQELLARIDALLRRRRSSEPIRERYRDGAIEIDFGSRQVRVHEREVALTPIEFRLLTTLVEHPNQVLSKDQVLEHVWGPSGRVLSDQVKLYVGYLRRKLALDPDPIETVRGFGYRYRPAR
jgi:DNA-binding response OmpR family regulator